MANLASPLRGQSWLLALESGLIAATPAPLLWMDQSVFNLSLNFTSLIPLGFAFVFALLGFLPHHKMRMKWMARATFLSISVGLLWPKISTNPFVALSAAVGVLFFGFNFFEPSTLPLRQINRTFFKRNVALWSLILTGTLWFFSRSLGENSPQNQRFVLLLLSFGATQWRIYNLFSRRKWFGVPVPFLLVLAVLLIMGSAMVGFAVGIGTIFVATLLEFSAILSKKDIDQPREAWVDEWISHPARVLAGTFLLLCFAGTILLHFPMSAGRGPIHFIDAAFTAVSAVCVTGLAVLDTPNDFSIWGQIFVLILIQLGGLGIMSLTTIALEAFGLRLSLKQERLMTSVTDTNRADLLKALSIIFKMTFIIETFGCLALTILFKLEGMAWTEALWIGLFTSISAFCNAGFALFSDSLMSYSENPGVLHVVSLLIILGGFAPATTILIPRWVRGRRIPLASRIPLVTSFVLLFSGTLAILLFEWNGFLRDLDLFSKFNNAWFQSVTLRTAGFNSVDLSHLTGPTLMVMLVVMLIGGSPGGTAGGIKTTAVGVLVLTVFATTLGKNKVIAQSQRIAPALIFKAGTILASFFLIGFLTLLMLEITQPQIPIDQLLFEVTSAIATVGLTIGATAQLDEVGKTILMLAMFAGRIGPMTLLMLFNKKSSTSAAIYPEAKINLS